MDMIMARSRDVALVVRALLWLLLALAAILGNASALMEVYYHDQEWGPPDPDYDSAVMYLPAARIIGIDLGNTNSCVAGYYESNGTMFHHCIPSWVAFADDGAVLVGEDARNYAAVNPAAAVVFGFKRFLGKRFSRDFDFEREFVAQRVKENRLPYKVVVQEWQGPYLQVELKTKDGGGGGAAAASRSSSRHVVTVEELTTKVVAKLKETAEKYYLGRRKVDGAILTLPLQFSDEVSRSTAVFAARAAGLEAVGLLREPVAAALAYNSSRSLREEGNVLVLHVGGGTAEASVLTFVDGAYETVMWQYDPFLGGQDFDRRIVDHFVQLVRDKYGKDVAGDGAAMERLRAACERAKKTLSHQDRAQVTVESLVGDGVDLSEQLTRAEFEELSGDLLRVVELVDVAVTRAEVEAIDEVLLIGGSTMMPKVRQLVGDYFAGTKTAVLHTSSLKPDEVVAIGAAKFSKLGDAYMYMYRSGW